MHSLERNVLHFVSKFVSDDPTDKNPALVQIMAWRLFGAKQLLETMVTQAADTNMSLGLNELTANTIVISCLYTILTYLDIS